MCLFRSGGFLAPKSSDPGSAAWWPPFPGPVLKLHENWQTSNEFPEWLFKAKEAIACRERGTPCKMARGDRAPRLKKLDADGLVRALLRQGWAVMP